MTAGIGGEPPIQYKLVSLVDTVTVGAGEVGTKIIHTLDNLKEVDATGDILGEAFKDYKTHTEETNPGTYFMGVRCGGTCAQIPLRYCRNCRINKILFYSCVGSSWDPICPILS